MGYILQGLQRYGYGWKQSYPEDGSVSGLDAGRANAKLCVKLPLDVFPEYLRM